MIGAKEAVIASLVPTCVIGYSLADGSGPEPPANVRPGPKQFGRGSRFARRRRVDTDQPRHLQDRDRGGKASTPLRAVRRRWAGSVPDGEAALLGNPTLGLEYRTAWYLGGVRSGCGPRRVGNARSLWSRGFGSAT
jgi:hypothetical protein